MTQTTAANEITERVQRYIDGRSNILLQGLHGIGKTAILTQAVNNLGLKMVYMSASTLDPFTDLVGVPEVVTDAKTGQRSLVMVRPRAIDEANVLVFDELNRADPKVHNAIFEIIQFGTINGEKLENLMCVVAAQNPPDAGYEVGSLDPALVDRFHFVIDLKPAPDVNILALTVGREVAKVLVRWYEAHSNKTDYMSPRRLEYLGIVWNQYGGLNDLTAALPPGSWDVGKLHAELKKITVNKDVADEAENVGAQMPGKVLDLSNLDGHGIRQSDPDDVSVTLMVTDTEGRRKIIDALAIGIPFPTVFTKWQKVLLQYSDSEVGRVINGYADEKKRHYVRAWDRLNETDPDTAKKFKRFYDLAKGV